MGNCCLRAFTGGASGAGLAAEDGANKKTKTAGATALSWLLEHGIIEAEEDVFKTDFSDGTMPPLHSQARKGNAGAVERLLSLDTEKSTTKLVYGSRTPLHQAAAANKGRLATCKLLLSFDEEQISAKTSDGSTPVHMLCQSDDDPVPVIQLFLKVGGLDLVREKKKDGSTILHLACTTGQLDLVTEILNVDTALASTVNGEVQTCLHIAAERGHLGIIQKLLEVEGVSLATKDRKGYTCLALAAMGGHSDVVKILADKDSSLLNIRDREGKSPIDLCAEHGKTAGHWAAAAVLLAMDPELLDAKPEAPRAPSPKEGAAGTKPKSKFGAAAMMLGGAKASASKAPTGLAMSTMHYAALHGQAAGVRLVLGLQTNAVENRDGDGNSPLHLACKGGHVEVLRLLLDINKGPGAPNTAGDTLLHAAAAAGQLECVTLVMRECPTLTTATNSKGHSSLMSATLAVDTAGKGEALKRAGKSAVAVSKALLDASPALLSMSDSKGQTCLHLAAKSGRCEDLVFLFAERGHAALIRTQDHDGNDCLALAPPNVVDILNSLLEREAEDKAAGAKTV